jgi:hypothetical protein
LVAAVFNRLQKQVAIKFVDGTSFVDSSYLETLTICLAKHKRCTNWYMRRLYTGECLDKTSPKTCFKFRKNDVANITALTRPARAAAEPVEEFGLI